MACLVGLIYIVLPPAGLLQGPVTTNRLAEDSCAVRGRKIHLLWEKRVRMVLTGMEGWGGELLTELDSRKLKHPAHAALITQVICTSKTSMRAAVGDEVL